MSPVTHVDHDGQQTFPSSGSAPWQTHLAAGLLDGTETRTTPQAYLTGDRVFTRERNRGTIYRSRMARPSGGTLVTNFQGIVFGRYSSDDAWQPIRNKVGDIVVTWTADDTNDVDSGTYQYTTPDLDAHSWDCDGFNEFGILPVQALDIGGGEATAFIQGRFL